MYSKYSTCLEMINDVLLIKCLPNTRVHETKINVFKNGNGNNYKCVLNIIKHTVLWTNKQYEFKWDITLNGHYIFSLAVVFSPTPFGAVESLSSMFAAFSSS